jgi:hypothetical protein
MHKHSFRYWLTKRRQGPNRCSPLSPPKSCSISASRSYMRADLTVSRRNVIPDAALGVPIREIMDREHRPRSARQRRGFCAPVRKWSRARFALPNRSMVGCCLDHLVVFGWQSGSRMIPPPCVNACSRDGLVRPRYCLTLPTDGGGLPWLVAYALPCSSSRSAREPGFIASSCTGLIVPTPFTEPTARTSPLTGS